MRTRRATEAARSGVSRAVRIVATVTVAGMLAGCTGGNASESPDTSSTTAGGSTPRGTGSDDRASGEPAHGEEGEGEEAKREEAEGEPANDGDSGQEPGSEVPAGATQAPQPAPTLPPQIRVTLPLPATASAEGEIVAGFPTAIVPVPPGAEIVASSVTGQGERLQIGLEATSASPPEEVIAFYRDNLTASGFTQEATPAADGAIAARFVRDGDGVVVSVRTALGGSSQISVAGALRADR